MLNLERKMTFLKKAVNFFSLFLKKSCECIVLSQSHPTLARWKEGFVICETPDRSGCMHICQTKVLSSWLGLQMSWSLVVNRCQAVLCSVWQPQPWSCANHTPSAVWPGCTEPHKSEGLDHYFCPASIEGEKRVSVLHLMWSVTAYFWFSPVSEECFILCHVFWC